MKERLEKRSKQSEESENRIREYEERIETLKSELSTLKKQKKEADQELEEAEQACSKQRGKIKKIEDEKEDVQERKEVNTELIHHLNMAKNKFEMQSKNITEHIWEEYELMMDQVEERLPEDSEIEEAKEKYEDLKGKLKRIGEVNPLAIEEYEEEKERLDFYEQQIEDLTDAEEQLQETIREINEKATEQFNTTFERIRDNFKKVFHTLFEETDQCDLRLEENEEDPLDAKIKIIANPRGKRPTSINQLSGGEKTLTAIALLFAIYLVKPSPFCVLDEVDAPLDDANIERFVNMLKQFHDDTQFIIITHIKKTMSNAERMYGVTMPDTGVSQLVSVQLEDVG
jgi:chromosome segregation protein